MITKAVIPAAGLGTRLLPATKEQPKEMLPIFSKGADGKLFLKPFLQVVYEKLYDSGFREFCFIVGKGKRSIEDHFTIDDSFLEFLRTNNKIELSNEMSKFYEKIQNSTLVFTNQPRPLGFGNAVYQARFFTGNEAFMVHAGDDLIISKKNNHLRRLVWAFEKYDADAAFLVKRVDDPTKYGVILGEKIESGVFRVKRIVEKPSTPPSDIGAIAIYIFNSKIYQAIEHTEPDRNNEIQLTDAIQQLIDQRCRAYALELNRNEKRIDVGTPESYKEAFIVASNS
jgi:UTP--glucose-1-phosphate uridylyltransferase